MSLMKTIFHYLARPYFYRSKETLSLNFLPVLGKILALKFGLAFAAIYVTSLIFSGVGVERPSQSSSLFENLTIGTVILIVIVAPFFEEVLFRSWLRARRGILYIYPLTLFLCILLLGRFFGVDITSTVLWTSLLCYIICAAIIFDASTKRNIDDLVQAMFPFAFWSTTTMFALIHLTNYNASEIGILGVLVVLPQFIAGTFYGYIVMRFGFIATFICHAAWNGSLIALTLLG